MYFQTSTNEKVEIPSYFDKFSQTTNDFVQNFGIEIEEKSIPLPGIEDSRSLLTIFRFLEMLELNDPTLFLEEQLSTTNVCNENIVRGEPRRDYLEYIESHSWMKDFFKSLNKDDLIIALNTSNYMDCRVFMEFGLAFIIKRLEETQTIEEFAEYLNEPIVHSESDDAFTKKIWADYQEEIQKNHRVNDKKSKK